MRKFFVHPLAILFIVALAPLACSSKYKGFDKTKTGLYYKLFKVSKDTATTRIGDWVSLNVRQVYKDSVMFSSLQQNQGKPIRFKVPPSDFKGDLMEGLLMMKAGDSAVFIVPVDSLFKKRQRPPKIDSNTVFYFYISMLTVDAPEALKKKEETTMAKYIADNNITVAPSPTGMYYIEQVAGKGLKVDTGCEVTYNVNMAMLDGTKIFQRDSLKFVFGKRPELPGFLEGVSKMSKGSKARLLLPSKLAFGEQGYREILPFTPLIYDVEVINVKSKADYDKEQALLKKKEQQKKDDAKKTESIDLQKYLKDHNITVKPTASGLYYIEKVKGTGAQAATGKVISVHYTGTLLNGRKFDSSYDNGKPMEFTLGKDPMIQGFNESISMMKKGGKATVIIPSSLGYGAQDKGDIPPYSTLVFDLEIVDVK